MKFISHAQNYEDVILYRALKNISHGFYIDIGAGHPITDSVTYSFYLKNWTGINLEPLPNTFDLLKTIRPKDVNLNYAVSHLDGPITIYSVDNENGLSTTCENYSSQYQSEGKSVEAINSPTITLTSICKQYAQADIHFLKIDVEGAEESVLKSADFKIFRPWIVLVESTLPNTNQQVFENWEYILLENDYIFVYFDGLNRFYLAKEKLEELKPFFLLPPNVIDNFSTYKEYLHDLIVTEIHSLILNSDIQENLEFNEGDNYHQKMTYIKNHYLSVQNEINNISFKLIQLNKLLKINTKTLINENNNKNKFMHLINIKNNIEITKSTFALILEDLNQRNLKTIIDDSIIDLDHHLVSKTININELKSQIEDLTIQLNRYKTNSIIKFLRKVRRLLLKISK